MTANAAPVFARVGASPSAPIEVLVSQLLQRLDRGEVQISWQFTK
jgi:hypothetical protein